MAYTSGSSQDGQSDAESNKQTEADKTKASVAASPEAQCPEDGQRRPSDLSDILSEENISNDKYDAFWYQSPLSKSLQPAEVRSQFNPGLKWHTRQKSTDSSWDSEGVASSSSRDIQRLGETLQNLSSQCHMLSDPASGGKPFGCVKGLSVFGESDFYYHPQMANFSRHYCQLQHLMEQRAQLLFLHEYAQRSHIATGFVRQLGAVLERMNLLLADRGQVAKEPNSMRNLGLRDLCQELQVHVNHWDLLWSRARSDPHLRRVLFSRVQMLSSMRQTLHLHELQALQLMERCIYTALSALAAAQVDRVSRDALLDLLCAVELYNQIVEDKKGQSRRSQQELSSDLFLNGSGPKSFPVEQLMTILAQSQAQNVAKQLYKWTSQQSHLLCEMNDLRKQRGNSEYPKLNSRLLSPVINIHNVQLEPQATGDEPSKKPLHSPWSSNLPFSLFVSRDKECLDALFKVLVSSTNLLAPCTATRPLLDKGEGEERLQNRPRMSSRTNMMPVDRRMSDTCMKLLCHYKNMLWLEFFKAAVRQFYYQLYTSTLGSVNQWSDEMKLRLVSWLRHSHTEDDIPEECKESLDNFCSYILCTAAFTQWDDMMCLSLGSGLKEKCVPVIKADRSAVRTASMDLILQLFPSLHTVLQLLQHSHSGSKRLKDVHLGVLYRSVATVQSSAFWVMSKAYQFLASWTLSKFLLVTQGDLKDLRGSVERLVQRTAAFSRDSADHLIIQQTTSLNQALTHLQAFSDHVLRIFSVDCKKMSVEIFEQTMPSGKHWRINYKTEILISPSDYAASAAQSVIGHVLEGVRPLPDDARAPALTEAMTAFMEAWMEHILKQKIKFSVQGALQLKQDFDLIRELIRSEQYSLSDELHQKLLSLRVFHQVDNAIVCLLQQPVAKPYLPSRGWEPFRHCCPNSAQVMDEAAGSLNNLESMDIQAARQQALTQAGSSVTPEPLSSTPPESYLAEAQQEWLDLRIHTGSRWKLPPVLRCFTKSES